MKLYVEVKNERAQKTYQNRGMRDAGELFLENDFYFEKENKFKEP